MAGYPPTSPSYPLPPRVRFDTIGEAWRWFQQNMGVWIGAIFIAGVIYMVSMVGSSLLFTGSAWGPTFDPAEMTSPRQMGGGFLSNIVTWCVSYWLSAGLFSMAIRQIRGEPIQISDLFATGSVWLKVLGASILTGLAMGAGFLLCILPGFVVAGLLMLTIPLIVEQRLGVTQAMGESWNALKGDWLNATAYYFVLSIIAVIGFLGCGVGILFTLPLYFLGIAGVYRDFYLTPIDPRPMEPFHYTQEPPPTPPPPP